MRLATESASFPLRVRAMMRLAPRFADAVVACSRGVAASAAPLLGLPERALRLIGNPAITPEMGRAGAAPVEHWPGREDGHVIVAAGRLAPQKNFPMLVRALAEVRKSADAGLVVLGEGPERSAIERLVRDVGLDGHVLLPGRVENPFPYMARCRVFALSSSWEGFANVLVEALAMGAPVVATDCPSGPAEILDGGRYGHLVPMDDHRAMARAILAVIRGERRDPPPERLRRYEAAVVADEYLELFGLRDAGRGAR
jgi:glycosyltransferase involved in cell wall biosynthesis